MFQIPYSTLLCRRLGPLAFPSAIVFNAASSSSVEIAVSKLALAIGDNLAKSIVERYSSIFEGAIGI